MLTLTATEIIDALRKAGYPIDATSKIIVRIPGGGDWSNTNLEIEEVKISL